ncbi:MAG: hypothetical protein EOP53_24670 [Sphingobacteriales bacterium]|nr:MAG: hypothetical protein EOP53_24670 [Sphingobacteriales bacterium]
MLKKDSFGFGMILGCIAPLIGLALFKFSKFREHTFSATLDYMINQDTGFRTLTVALSLSLLLNAVLFTVYINAHKDHTAKGIFATTVVYGAVILLIKTFY